MQREAPPSLRLWRNAADAEMDAERRSLIAAVEEARAEYRRALSYFENADADMVDHAVLRLAAAERHYAYLLGEVRRAGIRASWIERLPSN